MVLSVIAAMAFGVPLQTVTLSPTDDVWAYPHASDPGGDAYMRVWGAEGRPVPLDAASAEEYSFGFLKFALTGIKDPAKLKSAKLVVVEAPNPGFTVEQTKENPLQARMVDASFDEKGWKYDDIGKFLPKATKDGVTGFGSPAAWKEGEPITIEIDLLKGPDDFKAALGSAMRTSTRTLAFALTTPLDVTAMGRAAIFKIYSKEAEVAANRPKLVLEFED